MKIIRVVLFLCSNIFSSETPSSTSSVRTIRYYQYDPYGKAVVYRNKRPVVIGAFVKRKWIKNIQET